MAATFDPAQQVLGYLFPVSESTGAQKTVTRLYNRDRAISWRAIPGFDDARRAIIEPAERQLVLPLPVQRGASSLGPGITLGSSPNADVRVFGAHGVEQYHLVFCFDSNANLTVRDVGTSEGTSLDPGIGGSTRERPRRSGFAWQLQTPSHAQLPFGIPKLTIGNDMSFWVVLPSAGQQWDQQVVHSVGQVPLNARFPRLTIVNDEHPCRITAVGARMVANNETLHQEPLIWEQFIDEGGMGTVSKAWDHSTGDIWAVKRLRARVHSQITPDEMKAWLWEKRTIQRLNHANIVPLHHTHQMAPMMELRMEYIPLGNLDQQQRVTPFSLHEVAKTFLQISDALRYLHGDVRLAHRDIKPQNILVAARGANIKVQLTDFGFSKSADYNMFTCMGATKYTAPEQCDSAVARPDITVMADIWSFGVTMCGLLLPAGLPHYKNYHEFKQMLLSDLDAAVSRAKMSQDPFSPTGQHHGNRMLSVIQGFMVREEPEKRVTAQDLLKWAQLNLAHFY